MRLEAADVGLLLGSEIVMAEVLFVILEATAADLAR